MNKQPTVSRRKLLKALGGAPMLPMATGLSLTAPLAACGGGTSAAAPAATAAATPTYVSAAFAAMAAPSLADAAAMATTTVGSTLDVSFSDGSTDSFRLAYQPFFTTGDRVPDGQGGTIVAGSYFDLYGDPIVDTSVAGQERQFFSDCPDGTSLLTVPGAKVDGVKGNTVFAVVQFEYTSRNNAGTSMYGKLPSQIAVLTLDQDPASGRLNLVKYANVPTAPAKGLWITCGASLSPWGTHLSSEEYEPDATTIAANTQFQAFSQNLFGNAATARAYDYGHLPEVTVHADGTGAIRKHYCLGRTSHEVVQVMPDERTVLMGDDATNGGLFMFVADQARDLSAGTLYVAKWTQKTAANGGSATLTWINLGHATSDEIKALVAGGIQSTDIVDVKTVDPADPSYTKIRYSGKNNWVKFVPGKEKAAAFLETHRYAAFVGGSLGFTKMEGTTVNAKDKVAYSAMSYIQGSMIDGTTDIQVTGPRAGAVYALNMTGGQKDTAGADIASEWVPVDMGAMLLGEDLPAADALGNLAHADKVANPDNIKFSEKLRTLFIGEDSGMHVNNFLWVYQVDTKKLSRILSTPSGAESTGLQSVDEINGWTYVMSNFQHPGDWESPLHDVVKATLDPLVRANFKDRYGASVGYLTATPSAVKLSR
ncbi:MAG: DUF839 domain-containing protein [Burkholderiales bacterium]|nr:DUF839 domain-containing protein [Burkholderiales bacterium]